ncbi:polyphosphate kinase [Halorubrum coriense DSM 10284]|uniref:Polyphosphate kinase n=1 Tax=Halorubrum coriense DSM 10284 TaxID=1227466 RepID=M0ENP1_9EURY|nr:polyphosphate kinase 1 [Halorubrum coriense]ELZ49345.1 polyphosphate kinase [Halorubrum coriense DSM 10284]
MDDPDLTAPRYYLNRELSELAYQKRVLSEGTDERNPPLERLRFVAFFTKNTDEFFMKRVGGLKQQITAGITTTTPDGRTPREQLDEVIDAARPLFDRQDAYWRSELRPELADAGVAIREYDDLRGDRRDRLQAYFEESVLPTLTPLAFDPAHPFPFISNLSLSLAVLSTETGEETTFTRIKIPPNQPRLIEVPDASEQYVLIEDLIEANLDLLLPGLTVLDVSKFRVTRNAEVRRNEEVAEDLVDAIEDVLEQRRFATVVRLEVDADMPDESVRILTEHLEVDVREVFYREGPIDYEDFFELVDLDRPELKLPSWTPRSHPRLPPKVGDSRGEERPIFDEIRTDDLLVHHPYHTFEGTVQRFLDAAATDPDVLAVKAAIYRTASDSKVIQSLIDAADNGKQVAVMVELKARFDEENNLEWVRRLEEEGIHVAYGTIGLKTHTKTALVVRQEADGVQLYSHVGTGNYHSETAKGYSDLGLLTADRDVGQDLTNVFNFFTGPTLNEAFRKLLIAPVTMRKRFTEMVRREAEHARAGRRARIVVKVNGLEDPDMVAELYRASMAGVEIDLIVRDICRLRPGLEGVSENVTVHSIVGRFLEHARIFYFENAGDPEWYTGSADWMTRNLDHRVEAVTPVETPELRRQLRFVLEASLADNRRRWVMRSDGSYERAAPDDAPVRDIQEILMRATDAAVERGYGPGMEVDADLITRDLLVEPDDDGTSGDSSPATDDDSRETDHPDGEAASVFDAHAERWYHPDSETYGWAVRTTDGDRRYFKTREGARSRLRREYGPAT